MGVVDVERCESAVAALHTDEPIQGALDVMRVACRIARLVHRPGDDSRVVKVGVMSVRELKGPAPAR